MRLIERPGARSSSLVPPALHPVAIEAHPYNAETPMAALRNYALTPTSAFYVRNHFDVPPIDPLTWQLDVNGAVAAPRTVTLKQILTMPRKTLHVTLECAGNGRTRMTPTPPGAPWGDGAVGTASWTGTPLRGVLEKVRPMSQAREFLFQGADHGLEGSQELTFARSLPLDEALAGEALLAYRMNDRPLTQMHGAPLRLIMPRWYGVASVKWLTHIAARTTPFRGWYMAARYIFADAQQRAWGPVTRMAVKSLITVPAHGAQVRAGQMHTIGGLAWSGHGLIARVDVRTNASPWRPAQLARGQWGPYAWQRWSLSWTPRRGGQYTLMARATDERGNQQPMKPVWNFYGYGCNHATAITVEAR
jgi:DMSO/TMAO reductase YedYZ molybdopterin-dependent catalytic subunit